MQLQPTVQQFLLTDERTGNANVQPVDPETVSSEDDTNQQAALQPNNDTVESEDGDNNGSIVNQRDVDDEIQPGRGEIIEVIDMDEEEILEIDRTINETIDRHFEESAQEIWEEVRVVSPHVLRYAEDVLNTSYEQSQNPQSSPGPQSQNPQSSPGPSSQTSQPDQGMQMTVREEPILVKTVTGKSYQVPYEAVKNWNYAKPVLASLDYPALYLDASGKYPPIPISDILERGEFELVGPNNNLILPKFWSETVRPGWTIDLQFKNWVWEGKSTRDAYSPHSETITKAPEERSRRIWSVFKKK
ncbi:hypothetical protein BS50DRAFT_668310 [Corynespora cassiicola Philippines]|uniref:Ubiquitin-like domain-containing protein n=1 Tax=Corynespora cassiicola Philippines TaxID=1448308 RepID=A0A2T2NK24_CORCC|nr:hypothetical protein BS50DRAFT_668310 [Corynespora cassiicola Philippines]